MAGLRDLTATMRNQIGKKMWNMRATEWFIRGPDQGLVGFLLTSSPLKSLLGMRGRVRDEMPLPLNKGIQSLRVYIYICAYRGSTQGLGTQRNLATSSALLKQGPLGQVALARGE